MAANLMQLEVIADYVGEDEAKLLLAIQRSDTAVAEIMEQIQALQKDLEREKSLLQEDHSEQNIFLMRQEQRRWQEWNEEQGQFEELKQCTDLQKTIVQMKSQLTQRSQTTDQGQVDSLVKADLPGTPQSYPTCQMQKEDGENQKALAEAGQNPEQSHSGNFELPGSPEVAQAAEAHVGLNAEHKEASEAEVPKPAKGKGKGKGGKGPAPTLKPMAKSAVMAVKAVKSQEIKKNLVTLHWKALPATPLNENTSNDRLLQNCMDLVSTAGGEVDQTAINEDFAGVFGDVAECADLPESMQEAGLENFGEFFSLLPYPSGLVDACGHF